MKIIKLEEVDSTQTYLKENKTEEDTIVITKMQTNGYGRQGKDFSLTIGGLIFSFILKEYSQKSASTLYVRVAVILVDVFKHFGYEVKIKWPNDIFYNNKKLGGIIIEQYGKDYIVGIGMNIKSSPSTEYAFLSENVEIEEVFEKFIEIFKSITTSEQYIEKYNASSLLIGKNVRVQSRSSTVKVVEILENNKIIVVDANNKETFEIDSIKVII